MYACSNMYHMLLYIKCVCVCVFAAYTHVSECILTASGLGVYDVSTSWADIIITAGPGLARQDFTCTEHGHRSS